MKYAKRIIALTLVLLPVIAAAQMPSNARIVAQVPFEFMVGTKHIPAGECTVQTMPNVPGSILVIRNVGAKAGLFSAATPAESKKAGDAYKLVFHRYGNSYFLSSVVVAGSRSGYQLPESKGEAELRAQNATATETVLLASIK